jgi:hypothetical protein
MGNPFAEELRFVLKACVGEENFVDMFPNRSKTIVRRGRRIFAVSYKTPAGLRPCQVGQIQATKAYKWTPMPQCHAISRNCPALPGGWRTGICDHPVLPGFSAKTNGRLWGPEMGEVALP